MQILNHKMIGNSNDSGGAMLEQANFTTQAGASRHDQDFAIRLSQAHPDEILIISCVDYREKGRDGFLFTSAGNVVHSVMLEDLHLILAGRERKFLVLRGHTDCAKSKSEVPRSDGETDDNYQERVEARTLERLWEQAQILMADPEIKKALCDGLQFCVALLDTKTGATTYFEKQSQALEFEQLSKCPGTTLLVVDGGKKDGRIAA